MTGLLDRLDNSLDIEGLDGAEVDDLGLDAVLGLELLGGDEGLADATGECDNGEVLARALNLGLAKLQKAVSVLRTWMVTTTTTTGIQRTGMTKSSFWASSLMGKERP